MSLLYAVKLCFNTSLRQLINVKLGLVIIAGDDHDQLAESALPDGLQQIHYDKEKAPNKDHSQTPQHTLSVCVLNVHIIHQFRFHRILKYVMVGYLLGVLALMLLDAWSYSRISKYSNVNSRNTSIDSHRVPKSKVEP